MRPRQDAKRRKPGRHKPKGKKPPTGFNLEPDKLPAAKAKPDKEKPAERSADEIAQERAELLEMAVEVAQMTIDDYRLSGLKGLESVDKGTHDMIVDAGLQGQLNFVQNDWDREPTRETPVVETAVTAGETGFLSMDAEALRGAALNGKAVDEETMCRLIYAACFRIGTGNAYVGPKRRSVENLHGSITPKLRRGAHKKLFQRCWDLMAREGAIKLVGGKNGAGSLNLAAKVQNADLQGALSWASEQQKGVTN